VLTSNDIGVVDASSMTVGAAPKGIIVTRKGQLMHIQRQGQ
jgi:hypothetical protein